MLEGTRRAAVVICTRAVLDDEGSVLREVGRSDALRREDDYQRLRTLKSVLMQAKSSLTDRICPTGFTYWVYLLDLSLKLSAYLPACLLKVTRSRSLSSCLQREPLQFRCLEVCIGWWLIAGVVC